MRVAIIEADEVVCNQIKALMAEIGYAASQLQKGAATATKLSHGLFDLILLDCSLPSAGGIALLSWIKGRLKPPPPVIMLVGSNQQADIVSGLSAGAADYVTKPIHGDVLKKRVRAVLRRAYGVATVADTETEDYGVYVINVRNRTITLGGATCRTSAKEFDLALLLFRNPGRGLSRSHIMEAVWASAPHSGSRTLDAHISQVRRRLNLRPENGFRLSAIHGFGYRLVQVRQSAGADLRGNMQLGAGRAPDDL